MMKRLVIFIGMILFPASILNAQSSATAPSSQDSIIFEKTTHNYGTIKLGGNGVCEFKFTNKGKSPLILNNVTASCGCTSPDWSKAPVNPGETGFVKVSYNTQIPGAFSKTVTVRSNAVNSTVVLIIRGEVVAGNTN